jgi:hypothetical protein
MFQKKLSALQREHSPRQNMNCVTFSFLGGHFCLPKPGSGFQSGSDQQTQLNPDRSETLVPTPIIEKLKQICFFTYVLKCCYFIIRITFNYDVPYGNAPVLLVCLRLYRFRGFCENCRNL